MKIKYAVLLTLLLSTVFQVELAKAENALSGGGTVPWPWPWADECDIDFEGLKGMWVMADSGEQAYVLINTHWMTERRARYIGVELINSDMFSYAAGYTFTSKSEKTIRVSLKNNLGHPAGMFEIKIYHRNHIQTCDSSELVPIATIQPKGTSPDDVKSHYVLKPREPNSPEQNP